jgi:3-carboxy-cis,cis-muconate cycloisomerase
VSGQGIAAESAMMTLAPVLGRSDAYALVKRAVAGLAQKHGSLADALLADVRVRTSIDEVTLRAALDPAAYTGQSASMARQMAAAARAVAGKLVGR